MTESFRDYVPPPDHPRRAHLHLDYRAYSDKMLAIPPINQLAQLFRAGTEEPFVGITTDGRPQPELFPLADEGAPVEAKTNAAQALLARASPQERAAIALPLDSAQRLARGFSCAQKGRKFGETKCAQESRRCVDRGEQSFASHKDCYAPAGALVKSGGGRVLIPF